MQRQLKSDINKAAYALSQLFYQKVRVKLLKQMDQEIDSRMLVERVEDIKKDHNL